MDTPFVETLFFLPNFAENCRKRFPEASATQSVPESTTLSLS